MASPPSDPLPDGPPPYKLYGDDRFTAWRFSMPPEWVEWEVWLWISGLFWDPWQHPSAQSTPAGAGRSEVRNAVVPETQVGVSYAVRPQASALWLIEVADLP